MRLPVLLRVSVLKMTYQLLYLGAPLILVAVAHGLCIKHDLLKGLRRPLDLGIMFRGKRILGDHKTWRGFVVNIFFCILGTLVQRQLQVHGAVPEWLGLLDYSKEALTLGILMGAGMTFGELPNSFLKRRLEIPPGKKRKGVLGIGFFLLDQIDIAIGIWLFLFLLLNPGLDYILLSFLLTLVLHVGVSSLGYLLNMRKTVV